MSDFFITYGGKRYDSGLTYGDSSQGEIRFDLGENQIVETLRYLSGDGSLRVNRAVISGGFSFNNGTPSGEVRSASLFSVTIESGFATEFAQSYNFNPALTVTDWLAGYPTVYLPEDASSANYFYTNSANLSVGRGQFTETPIFSSRDSLAGLADMNYFPNYWWENPFSYSLGTGGNTSTSDLVIPKDLSIFSVTPSSFQINEEDSINTSLSGFTPNSTFYFKVVGSGVSKKDFAAGLVKGSLKVDANGVASIAHTLKADKKTEGAESFTIQVFSDKKMKNLVGQSDAVAIGDTSAKAVKGGGSANNGSAGNLVTGNWSWDGRDIVTGQITSNNTKYKTYFGVVGDGTSEETYSTTTFSGYADSNGNGTYDPGLDLFVGTATLIAYAMTPAYSGTFDADKSTGIANGFVGNTLVATAAGAELWFA